MKPPLRDFRGMYERTVNEDVSIVVAEPQSSNIRRREWHTQRSVDQNFIEHGKPQC